ncbi:MAG: LLM class flavin-dependent oxidoreductase [Acidimicrobiales bacterium]|nr:LLM class flavin-dependent oxidoreductase [Acidimicrobiales bacterium]
MSGAPLATGSISLRLYPHDLDPARIVAEIRAQSALAEEVGFDGVMTQEHHGGFPNYLPNPLLAATWALDATTSLWAAPCPVLLPLRPWTQLVEDLAWTAARFPGRVGAGVGAGAFPLDFEMAGVPFDELRHRFRTALPDVADALAGRAEGPVSQDPGVAALAENPIPLVVAAQGPRTVQHAGSLGLGVIFNSLQTAERSRDLAAIHSGVAGSAGPRVLIRRVWIGPPPRDAMDVQMARYRAVGPDDLQQHWADDGGLVAADSGAELAERLAAEVASGGCDTVNVRVFQAGLTPNQVREQIGRLGAEMLPPLRNLLAT